MSWSRRIPLPLRPLVGSLVLVAGVRLLDAVWQRRSEPVASGAGGSDGADTAPHVIRERLVHALLLSCLTVLAARVGTPTRRSRHRGSA